MASNGHRNATVSRLSSNGRRRSFGRGTGRLLLFSALLIAAAHVVAAQSEYVIGPHDVLVVNVFGQSNLTGKYTVEADGAFTFAFIGRVQVGGMTLRAAGEALTKRLTDGWLKRPQVSVAVEEYRSKHIFILGEIRQPGEYTLTGETTLLAALARAGQRPPKQAARC